MGLLTGLTSILRCVGNRSEQDQGEREMGQWPVIEAVRTHMYLLSLLPSRGPAHGTPNQLQQ